MVKNCNTQAEECNNRVQDCNGKKQNVTNTEIVIEISRGAIH